MVNTARKQGLDSPFGFSTKPSPQARVCDWSDCAEGSEFRTAKSPRNMSEQVWYCADHIREHNKAWNYFEGLDDTQVEAIIKNDTVWQRPTWEMGSKGDAAKARAFANGARIRDDFGLLNEDADPRAAEQASRAFPPDSPVAAAFAVMNLVPPITIDDAKARYKKLVKQHHPDANGGSKISEETFKALVQAYQVVTKYLQA